MLRIALTLIIVGVVFLTQSATAHGLRTGFIEITEREPGRALVVHRVTVPDASTTLDVDPSCSLSSAEDRQDLGGATARAFQLTCDGSIAGHTITMRGLGPVIGESAIRIVLADGREESGVLTAASPSFTASVERSSLRVGSQYIRLGVVHILTGADHLLFLCALVLLVRRARAVLVTETAFTLSHSLSFAATALGVVHVSSVAAEACIAVSLVLVALDVGVGRTASTSHAARLAFAFGFVHGLGFAGGLAELGLPDGYTASALVGFGLGVELGQIAFLGLLLGALHLLGPSRAARSVPKFGAYAAGAIGSFWLIERTLAMFAS